MPTARTSDFFRRIEFRVSRLVLKSCGYLSARLLLGAALACAICLPRFAEAQTEKPKLSTKAQTTASAKKHAQKKPYRREGYAVWYVVPANSLAKRRAEKGQLTAAHNQLPLGTMVRVTHLANGKSVIVRITDRGITKRGATIDLCKEAAEKLGIISEGMARVRIEELPDDKGPTAISSAVAAPANP
jgi:rare lipoprotein A